MVSLNSTACLEQAPNGSWSRAPQIARAGDHHVAAAGDGRTPIASFRLRVPGSVVAAGLLFLALVLLAATLHAQDADDWRVTKPASVRFVAVDVFVDSGAQPLGAYQLTFFASRGDVKIVSIEGGEHPVFKEPPYYDPQAIQQERAVLAAFSTAPAGNLPKGKTRVATIHVQVSGAKEPEYKLNLTTAAASDAHPISAECSSRERNAK
jgi:hypothetical protein